jgi:GT2 family glycosyltransferase
MPPKVSIVMSVYNGEIYLAEAINSMLRQTFTDFEFIIVDDGSSDHSDEIIADYTKHDSRVSLLSLEENTGLATALNHGIRQATGTYIARMDCDDVSLSTRLQQQVDYMEMHPDVIVLGSQMQVVDHQKNSLFLFEVPQEHSLIIWNLFFGRTFAHPSVMMRRDALKKVGGYDATIPVAQDVDLWARLVGQGRFANLGDELLLYRTHDQATSVKKAEQQNAVLHATLKRLLTQVWGDVLDSTVQNFLRIRSGNPQFSPEEYEQVTLDLKRLAMSLHDKGWTLSNEQPLIEASMNRLFKTTKPDRKRLWNILWKRD